MDSCQCIYHISDCQNSSVLNPTLYLLIKHMIFITGYSNLGKNKSFRDDSQIKSIVRKRQTKRKELKLIAIFLYFLSLIQLQEFMRQKPTEVQKFHAHLFTECLLYARYYAGPFRYNQLYLKVKRAAVKKKKRTLGQMVIHQPRGGKKRRNRGKTEI